MDKKERGRIIAVKLQEVLEAEKERKDAENAKETAKLIQSNNFLGEMIKMDLQLERMTKARDTYRKECKAYAKDIVEHFKNKTVPFKLNYSTYGSYYGTDISPKTISVPTIEHNNILTDLMSLRSSENERIREVVKAGMNLILNDDMEAMEKFMEM